MAVTKNNGSKLKIIDLSDDTTVVATGSNSQVLQPPEGYLYKVRYINYGAADPSGSSAGTHYITAYSDGSSTAMYYFKVTASTGNVVRISSTIGSILQFVGDSSEFPSDVRDQIKVITDMMMASYDYPITFVYKNSTDVSQTGTRVLRILVEEIPERA